LSSEVETGSRKKTSKQKPGAFSRFKETRKCSKRRFCALAREKWNLPDLLKRVCRPAIDALLPPAAGRMEGIEGGDLVGWVYQSPSAPHAIQVKTDLNHIAEFGAHVWHSGDRAERPRKLGFAVPLELLPPFSEKVFVTNPEGVLLRDGEVTIREKPPADAHRQRYLIVHIPKTAGTSLKDFLNSNLRKSDFCAIYDSHPNKFSHKEFWALPASQRGRFKLVMGHVNPSFSEHMLGDIRVITFLRRPLDRVRSHVLDHLRTHGPDVDTPQGRMPLEKAINEGCTEIADNLQTRALGQFKDFLMPKLTSDHLQQVKDVMRERFAFVGFAENGSSDILRLARMLGIRSRRVGRQNTAPRAVAREITDILDRIDWQRVAERNAFDEELYRWAQVNFDNETGLPRTGLRSAAGP
jgi:hypothetical protein